MIDVLADLRRENGRSVFLAQAAERYITAGRDREAALMAVALAPGGLRLTAEKAAAAVGISAEEAKRRTLAGEAVPEAAGTSPLRRPAPRDHRHPDVRAPNGRAGRRRQHREVLHQAYIRRAREAGVLSPGDAETLRQDEALGTLGRLLRQIEMSGRDAQTIFHEAITERELDSADSLAQVLACPGPAVVELYQEVKSSLDAPSTSPTSRLFGRGILAAIEFATGVQPTAPVSGEPAEENPPPVGQLSREEERAADIAAGHVRAQVSRDYATGVEHTIMWLLARTDTRPWGRLR
ncbi:hypothetical protein [Actinomadura mexicana]|uniref:Uncharacterized protein n=1 Tax=Actinomadura mexicana TaxID=134959 RepID=A0A239GUI3_9ACTN|nr:hypothetical protein [Actinomadura mexicana]SNS72886.1 hypothetical protein SAMN06265355_12639 [Actinomadura mexicana]